MKPRFGAIWKQYKFLKLSCSGWYSSKTQFKLYYVRPWTTCTIPPLGDVLHSTPCFEDWEWDRTHVHSPSSPRQCLWLTDDCFAGKSFGVRLPSMNSPRIPIIVSYVSHYALPILVHVPKHPLPLRRTKLNDNNAPSFTLKHDHHSLVSLLLAIRSLAETCIHPPELKPNNVSLTPIGSSLLLLGPSQ